MPMVATDNKHYKNIANAIRLNSGKSELFKPEEMSTGIEQVYNKGKSDFGYKKSVSGSYITIDDVSSNEKKIYATLTSDTVTDFSNTKLTVCGENLFDSNKLLQCQGWKEEDGVYSGYSWCVHDVWGGKSIIDAFEPNTQYTVSFDGYHINPDENTNTSLHVHIKCTDNWYATLVIGSNEMKHFALTTPAGKTVKSINLSYGYGYKVFVRNFQVTKTPTKEEFEPYIGVEYTPDADGKVNDIIPCYPITNMFTNNIDVTINAEYYADSEKIIGELTDTIISLGGTLDV